jgi:predicted GIY-YIG superfamily endonuclease
MTSTAPEITGYEATIQHMALLSAKVAKLNELRVQAEDQLIARLAADYRAGLIGAAEVYDAFLACKEIKAQGFRDRWNAYMPWELNYGSIVWTAVKYAPDDDGNWRGEWPFTDDTRTPPTGANVVYVLFDARNDPCYVGSSEQFRTRLRSHGYSGKKFVRWLAYPCADREAAYELEDRLLKQHQPYLNKRASR